MKIYYSRIDITSHWFAWLIEVNEINEQAIGKCERRDFLEKLGVTTGIEKSDMHHTRKIFDEYEDTRRPYDNFRNTYDLRV